MAHNPQSINETVQRVILSESMINDTSETVYALEDRVLTSKLDGFVNTFTSSLEGIEKTFQHHKDIADTVNKNSTNLLAKSAMKCGFCCKDNHTEANCFSKLGCNICGKRNHTTYNCFYKDQNNRQTRPNHPFRGRRPQQGGFQRQRYQQRRPQYYQQQPQQFQPMPQTQQRSMQNHSEQYMPEVQYEQQQYPTIQPQQLVPQQQWTQNQQEDDRSYGTKNGNGPRA